MSAKKLFSIILVLAISMLSLHKVIYFQNITITNNEKTSYSTKIIYDDTVREGARFVKKQGVDGSKAVTYSVTKNIFGKEVERSKIKTETIKQSQDEQVVVGTKKYYTCSNGTEYDNVEAKNECEKRINWEASRASALAECNADSSKMNCWYDAYPGTYVHWTWRSSSSYYTPAPGPSSGLRSGAICMDGATSMATGRGACSHHGGVSHWF